MKRDILICLLFYTKMQ